MNVTFTLKCGTGSRFYFSWADLTLPPQQHHSPALSFPQSRAGVHRRGQDGFSYPKWAGRGLLVNRGRFRVSSQSFPLRGWEDSLQQRPLSQLQDTLHCVMQIRVQELTSCFQEVMVSPCLPYSPASFWCVSKRHDVDIWQLTTSNWALFVIFQDANASVEPLEDFNWNVYNDPSAIKSDKHQKSPGVTI